MTAHELNMLLRLADDLGVTVSVDTVERDGFTEIVVCARDRG